MSQKRMLHVAAISAAMASVAVAGYVIRDASPHGPLRATSAIASAPWPAQVVGTFTGDYVDGAPVYRLPSIHVAVSRKAELARIEAEERLAQADATPPSEDAPLTASRAMVAAIGPAR